MNEQEIVEQVVANLYEQNAYAADENGFCVYRLQTENKILKCAIGGLIPDELYNKKFEGDSAWGLPENIIASIAPDTKDLRRFLSYVQISLHDSPSDTNGPNLRSLKYRNIVREFCDRFDLSSEFLNNYSWELITNGQ